MNKIITVLLLLGCAHFAVASPFATGDAVAGEQLFKQLKCNSCHINMMGGDGSAIFTRPNSRVHNAAQLSAQITRCGGNVEREFSAQETQNIAAYLNRYYQLK
ncbi:MAG: cytochrome c [Sideroxydans sp.]|nr:cytochrome c [Sideroxydans sp.]